MRRRCRGISDEFDWSMPRRPPAKRCNVYRFSSKQDHERMGGLRPLTPDEHAIIDYLPSVEGVLCAVGFCGHGFQHSRLLESCRGDDTRRQTFAGYLGL